MSTDADLTAIIARLGFVTRAELDALGTTELARGLHHGGV